MSAFFSTLASRTGLNPVEARRFARFTVVGAIGAVVDFGSYNLFLSLLQRLGGLPATILPGVAGSFSFVLAIISNFVWNRYWTYPDSRSKPLLRQFVQFFLVNALAIVIRVPVITFTHAPFSRLVSAVGGPLAAYAERIGNNLALALAVGLALFWNFFVNRYWTYNDVD